MNIIICDDDKRQVTQIQQFLSSRNGYTIFTFHSGEELLNELPQSCDIAILDIKLQDTLGTKLAEKLQTIYPEIDVIFISAYPKYVTSAFRIKASQFLVKPINKDTFLSEFDYILAQRRSQHYRWIVTNKNSIHALSPDEIAFVEAYHRHLFIHTPTQSIDICGSLKDACKELECYGFVLCHQGFLINIKYIHQIKGDTIILSTGDHIPISYRKRKDFIKYYTKIITR